MTGLNVTIHCARLVTYNHKGLIFYKDPKEPTREAPQATENNVSN